MARISIHVLVHWNVFRFSFSGVGGVGDVGGVGGVGGVPRVDVVGGQCRNVMVPISHWNSNRSCTTTTI